MTPAACYEANPSSEELFGSSATVSTLFQDRIPRRFHLLPIDANLFREEWRVYMGVQLLSEYEIQSKIDIIENFASTLIENTKDINPIFAIIAKESIWDLI